MTKTIVILAIATAFLVGTSMSFVVSDFEAEAKEPKINPVAEAIDRLTEVMLNTATAGPQGEQGPAGDDGQDGEQGDQGDPGPVSLPPIYTLFFNVQSTGFLQQFDCDAGDIALSGGLGVSSGGTIVTSRAGDQTGGPPPGWRVTVTPAGVTTLIDVICADVSDPPHDP